MKVESKAARQCCIREEGWSTQVLERQMNPSANNVPASFHTNLQGDTHMAIQVCMGATMQCSFGAAPSVLTVIPKGLPIMAGGPPAATIMDHIPLVNILPFGMCASLTNPAVATATTAASGVLTPVPCVPVVPAPWAPGSPTILINNFPALNNTSKCLCTWAGVISITNPGQTTVQIP